MIARMHFINHNYPHSFKIKWLMRSLRKPQRNDHGNVIKQKGLMSNTVTVHWCIKFVLPSSVKQQRELNKFYVVLERAPKRIIVSFFLHLYFEFYAVCHNRSRSVRRSNINSYFFSRRYHRNV